MCLYNLLIMKKIIFLLLILTLCIIGCSNYDNYNYNESSLISSDPILERSEPYLSKIVSNDIKLRTLASSKTSNCYNTECKVNSIYRWVVENYNYHSDPRITELIQSPYETLNIGGGDCEDLAILTSSLLENLGIKTYLVFTDNHAYSLACGINGPNLQEEILLSLTYEENIINEIIAINPHYAKIYGGSGEIFDYPREFKYDFESNIPIDVHVVPSSESLNLWSEHKSYSYYSTCSHDNILRGSDSCKFDRSVGIMLINDNDISATIDLNIFIEYLIIDINGFAMNYYNINNEKCVVLDTTLGEYGYLGYNTNLIGDKIAIDPVTLEYEYLE